MALTIPPLEAARSRARRTCWPTQTAAVASVFIYDSGLEALPIGGFTGTIPSPTLAQLQADIRQGRFHLVLAAASTDPRLRWIAAHCQPSASAAPGPCATTSAPRLMLADLRPLAGPALRAGACT